MGNEEVRAIKRELEDKGFTLTAIASGAGLSTSTVSHTLRNPRHSPAARAALVKALGRDPWATNTPADTSAA